MGLIKYSPNETRILGLKVGHLTTSRLCGPSFAEALIEGRYDLCRLKVRTDRCIDSGVAALEEAGLPYFYAGGILRYHRDYRKRPYERRYELPDDLEFLTVEPAREALLVDLTRRCFRDDPIGYYKTPWLGAFVSREAEVECLVEYCLRGDDTGRFKVIVKSGGEDAGFIVMKTDEGTLHTELLGVEPAYRGRGLFNPMRDFIHLHASEQGICEEEGARIDNLQSQNLFEDDGLKHFANETIFHVVPFLSRSETPERVIEAEAGQDEAEAAQALGREIDLQDLVPMRRLSRLSRDWERVARGGTVQMTLRVPVRSADLVVAVAEIAAPGQSGQPAALRYTEYRRPGPAESD